ncbi:calcium-binding protein [Oryzicola mucosus]|uniref:Calcium-binding protein n=1 Tax=Oryzicola mucosus TaxID=2767425 RepID=A0A8J6U3T9_9HYPH|nr:calcium-binding protein [Oryzicola mucosus]MBD0413245.1 calcium-binding protein [Oryzicola mucosus]
MGYFYASTQTDMRTLQLPHNFAGFISYSGLGIGDVSYSLGISEFPEETGIYTNEYLNGFFEVVDDGSGNPDIDGYVSSIVNYVYLQNYFGPPIYTSFWQMGGINIDISQYKSAESDFDILSYMLSDSDNIGGSAGDDQLYGFAGDDSISGYYGNDKLFGGAGTDTIFGGWGNDMLDGGGDDDYLYGEGGNDTLIGGEGNDTLDGGIGADRMTGGLGDDTYYVDNAGDIAIEKTGQGTDSVISSVTYTLKGQYIENLELVGEADINATGNKLANTIIGNSGDNIINGMLGADFMSGGDGNDTYYVDNVGDVVAEYGYNDHDVVNSTVSYSLEGFYAEDLNLLGTKMINGTGNELANALVGNGVGNILNGKGGNDTLTGGAGADRFVFDTDLGPNNIDTITDFYAPADSIRLDADIFVGLTAGALILESQFKDMGTGLVDADDRIL